MDKTVNLKIKLPEKECLIALGSIGGIAAVYYLNGKLHEFRERRRLTNLRTKKQQERQQQFDELERKYPLRKESAAIVALPFETLVEKLQARSLTAQQVLEAYVAKSIAVTKEFNCVTEFVPKCFEWAKELDASPKVKGPLHGVPICIKDDHDIEGMDTTMGYSIYLDQHKEESAVMIKILQDAGAIPFCKTNLPQTIFSYGSHNPIYGTYVNPLNKDLSPGGSSGGTGCLVAGGGALLGLGSDLGGSVRIPSHFCGISTLRSTIGRLSGRGILQCLEDNAGYTGVSGIMAITASTLSAVYKVAVTNAAQNLYDPLTVPIPWNSEIYESKKPLRIGYYTSLSFFPTLGDTPDTVLKAKAALESMGHTVIPFEIPDHERIIYVYATLATADGGNGCYKKLQYDEVAPPAEKFVVGKTWLSYLQNQIKTLLYGGSRFSGDPEAQNSEVLWQYLNEQRLIKYNVLDKMRELQLDLILAPVFPFPATRVNDAEDLISGVAYTCLYNFLDFPAGVTPFGKESCTKIDSYDHRGLADLKLAKEGIKFAKGMPIGVQIVGKPFKEEMVLRVLAELEEYRKSHY